MSVNTVVDGPAYLIIAWNCPPLRENYVVDNVEGRGLFTAKQTRELAHYRGGMDFEKP